MSRAMAIADELATKLATDVFTDPGDPLPQPVRVPVLDRKDIPGLVCLVSPASREPIRRNRTKLDHVVELDIGICKPLGDNPDSACEEVEALADDCIDAIEGYVFSDVDGRVISMNQPTLIDPSYFREHRLALTVIRVSVRSF